MINYLGICLLVIGIVFCRISPTKASEISDYFNSCTNSLWKQNNVEPDGSPITYKWILGDDPKNKVYKIEKYKNYEILTALFTSKNIEKNIDLESVGSVIWIAVKRPFVRVKTLNDASDEAIEDFKRKYIHSERITKNTIFIFIEDSNGNFNGHPTKPLIRKLMKNEKSNDLQVFSPHSGCTIERQTKDYDIMQTFGHVREDLDPENQLRCIATIVYTHYGISNPDLFYKHNELVRKMLDFADDRFRVGINYTPLYSLYPPKDSIYSPLLGSTGCELWDKEYIRNNEHCLNSKKEIENGSHDYVPSFVDYMRSDCKKFNIKIE